MSELDWDTITEQEIEARIGEYFGPVPERVEVTYCTEFCDDACICSLAASNQSPTPAAGDDT